MDSSVYINIYIYSVCMVISSEVVTSNYFPFGKRRTGMSDFYQHQSTTSQCFQDKKKKKETYCLDQFRQEFTDNPGKASLHLIIKASL